MSQRPEPWIVDPEDPRAPPLDIWEQLSSEQRARIVDSLPSEFEASEAQPPEGDPHFNAKVSARKTLGRFFERVGRRIYLACELPVYYPAERMFAPDVFAVTEVEPHERQRWVVADEGKGLDFALEIFVSGNRRKDHEDNVERYARLGIREYFIFDRGRMRLSGFRLSGPRANRYEPIVPQRGHYVSDVLGLELVLDGSRLRFYYGDAELPEAEELIAKLEGMLNHLESRLVEAEEAALREARLRQEEARLRQEETQRRQEAERRLAEALHELEKLKR
ncbi:MAG TPA: Uma2 family endonuclease [Polyangiaceae bacterium]